MINEIPLDDPLVWLGFIGLGVFALGLVCLLLLRSILRSQARSTQRDAAIAAQLDKMGIVLEQSGQGARQDLESLRNSLLEQFNRQQTQAQGSMQQLGERFGDLRTGVERRMGEMQAQILQNLQGNSRDTNRHLSEALQRNSEQLGRSVDKLTQSTDQRLKEISAQVDERLRQGFEKTNSTFTEVVKRLALIDQAQQRISELSSNVVSLQDILADKRSRGAFGEVQLEALIRNALPEQHIAFQHSLSNGTRVDCLLRLPPPTGDICIDAKFPLENFQQMTDSAATDELRAQAARRFKQDIRKHVGDIAAKYIVPGETAVGAIMFVPAESVFAEIHAHHGDLVRQSHDSGVWLCSPSTLMAVLTTARAVLRDDALRKQTGLLRKYLQELHREFDRFGQRMDKLSRHIANAHEETRKVHITAGKISKRFAAIEHLRADENDDDDAIPLAQHEESQAE